MSVAFFLLVVGMCALSARKSRAQSWSTAAPMAGFHPAAFHAAAHAPRTPRAELLRLRESDPAFSLVLFDDFLIVLYTELKIAQGKGLLARFEPYLSPAAALALAPPGGEIASVIVGSATVTEVWGVDSAWPRVQVVVGFETNYAIHDASGQRAVYAREQWTLSRSRSASSKPPQRVRMLGCPSCGAPLDVVVAGACTYCKAQITGGTFDWVVDEIRVFSLQPRGPMLTSEVTEQGTDAPTIVTPGAIARFTALTHADGTTTWDSLTARTHVIFHEFQTAWAARDLATMRSCMSDALFATQTFWVEEYKRQGLRNITEDARITRLEIANVTSDAYYDAVTVRLHAASLDYTVADATGELVSGSRTHPRRYTEYWTLIRGRGADAGGAPQTGKICPACTAPLEITMAGLCSHCQAKVTTAKFDWVLSRIEQDEVYRG
jgi:hypothetical protein